MFTVLGAEGEGRETSSRVFHLVVHTQSPGLMMVFLSEMCCGIPDLMGGWGARACMCACVCESVFGGVWVAFLFSFCFLLVIFVHIT